MSQITLRQIPPALESQIRFIAREKNLSLNQIIIDMLKKCFGYTGSLPKKRDLSAFAGTWSSKEVKNFKKATSHFSKIDKKIWDDKTYEGLY